MFFTPSVNSEHRSEHNIVQNIYSAETIIFLQQLERHVVVDLDKSSGDHDR
jgi:hypothetical protein